MTTTTILHDLYGHDAWANQRLVTLCDGLTDQQLDEPREMGFGTLRNTLFHILAAEEIWLERWQGQAWRPFEVEAGGQPLSQIAARLDRVAAERRALMDREQADGWQRVCDYKNAQGDTFRNRLEDLLLHVANHGIHHRAQALSFLKQFGRTVPGGLDFIFYRLARPALKQDPATAAAFGGFGLEIDSAPGHELCWNADLIQRYFAYSDWANARLLDLTAPLDATSLDRSWGLGMDTIRKTALHGLDAERWWLKNWTEAPAAFEKWPETTPIERVRAEWTRVIEARNRFVAGLDSASAERVVTPLIGPTPVKVAVIESLVQLCGHGTHHRAQWVNMLRRTDVIPPAIDVIVWLRQL